MTATLVIPDAVAAAIDLAVQEPLETAGVLLATLMTSQGGDTRLLGREMIMVGEAAYIDRQADSLAIASGGYVEALARAESLGAAPIWFHTHPGERGLPRPSRADKIVDTEIADLFRLRSGAGHYGTLIASPRGRDLAFSGTLQPETGPTQAIERLWRVGEDWRLTRAIDAPGAQLSPIFDRNIRAFGAGVQAALGDLRLAVVGCGGTGSATAEQLVRLGVRKLLLVDADTLSASNVTRVYGSTPADVGRPKAEVLRDHLRTVAPDLECEALVSMITMEATARRLASCDLIFGCTDDNAGRLVLSRMSSFLLIPVIDLGVLLSSDSAGQLVGIDGRVTILSPGTACLVCRDRIDLARAAVELRTPEERRRLEDEGYAPALGGVEPAVVAFTTAVAAAAVNELLERLVGYGPTPRPGEVLLRLHEREVSTNRAAPRQHHYCDPASGKLGAGPSIPFLEQTWPTA
ncbi:ThiF family adenylyltransferase [Phenylobacterium sp.]|uniref:ThiF family adenylyltransferase n=1 Tax=Phenylobacterium sp. TaxID=1871053 RepID=UPI002E37ACDA|nr:ThiF family adenylyltransferase [Phenylobacterium sp.]HEX3365783.1 ThiF family adenylyltransferase [Phenylobacterium sp.]